MVYAIASIGILGFIVWSFYLNLYILLEYIDLNYTVALPYCEVRVINIAICWNSLVLVGTFNCKNPSNYTQSAGNLYTSNRSLKSSSETTRNTSFNLKTFNRHYLKMYGKPAPDHNWLIWLIGFVEGNGAILTSNGRQQFVLTQKEGPILFHIKEILGFGSVKFFPSASGGYYRLIVTDKASILTLGLLFNGNLVLPHRISQLRLWRNISGFQIMTIPVIPTLTDAWLSGFADAEGCFNVTITPRSNTVTGYRVGLRFLLDQKLRESVLQLIRNLFGFGKVSLRSGTDNVYRLTVNSFKGLVFVRDYFLLYPLRTKKAISFLKWNEVYGIALAKEHLDAKGLAKIRVLAKEINVNNADTTKTGSSNP